MSENEYKCLKDKLVQTIKRNGPINLGHYMSECLGDETFGYYMVENPFGAKGDFITAPEVSQMFGEIIGLMLLDNWMKDPSDKPINLVELGPGQGTLMADILRVLSVNPQLKKAIRVHFIEMSPRLKELQAEKVPSYMWNTTWHKNLSSLPSNNNKNGTTWFVANEFFDALPAHQFQKTDEGWVERAVGLTEDDDLCMVTIPAGEQISLMDKSLKASVKTGDVVEVCPAAISIMGDITTHLKTNGGIATIIDYGYGSHLVSDTLQAVKNHKFSNILDQPGKQDLTTHVNFAALKQVASEQGLKTFGPIYQGEYLNAIGIWERAKLLSKNANTVQQTSINKALNRLTDAQEMGELFKVLVVVDEASPIPAPFSTE